MSSLSLVGDASDRDDYVVKGDTGIARHQKTRMAFPLDLLSEARLQPFARCQVEMRGETLLQYRLTSIRSNALNRAPGQVR